MKNANSLGDLLPYLKNYPHSLVFAEDIDQVTSGERDTLLNDLLNSIDGADLKGVDVVFLLTTNAQDKINPAMRRPGRIDEVVKFDFCSTETISKIYKFHLDGLAHAEDIDWDEAARYTPENLPGATVTEIALRAKEYTKQLHNGIFSTEVLKDAIASMKSHIEFMRAEPTVDNSLNQAVKTVFGAGMAGY